MGRCAAAEAGIEGMRRTNTRAEQVLHTIGPYSRPVLRALVWS